MKNLKVLFFFLFTAGLLTSCRSVPPVVDEVRLPSTLTILDDLEAQERIMLIFEQAYPTKISSVQFYNDDWTMLVNGARFYFANGRFLPEYLRDTWEDFLPWDFYQYPWVGTEEERLAAFRNPVFSMGSSFLFDYLYSAHTEDESWAMQEKYSFLGVKMLVHQYIRPRLDIVQSRIRAAALDDPSINEWIAELRTSPPSFGWTWRNIAGTNRRSLHSYGIAIDLLPRDLRGRFTFWQWGGLQVNRDRRGRIEPRIYWLPPQTVISIFEEHGFLWGGNWSLIDTMHFEYRPEILLINNFVLKDGIFTR